MRRTPSRVAPALLMLAALSAVSGRFVAAASPRAAGDGDEIVPEREAIGVNRERPQYFRFRGRDVLLLGGSKEDNLFQIPDLTAHLDELAAVGGNYVRCTMSSRDEGNVWPFHFDEAKGAYDLDRWNEEYWSRFARLLEEADRRRVVVQVELWATFDFYREPWRQNPFNPRRNLNYTAERTRLPESVPTHPTWCENRFFWSMPHHDNNMPVLAYQQRFVDRLLEHTLRHGNVLYCMDNETSVTAEWGRFWASYVKKRAREEGRSVLTTEMWDPWDLGHVAHRETFDHPELYDFVEISQNNHQRGQAHWDNGRRQLERLRKAEKRRPVTNVKTYGADGGRHGGDTDEAVAKFVRSAFFGSAAVRFHRPPSGIGLSAPAKSTIRGLHELSERMAFLDAAPHDELLGSREPNEAYCRARPGREYAVYFPDGGSVTLDLAALAGPARVSWLELLAGRWSESLPIEAAGASARLEAPGRGHWIALVTSAPGEASEPVRAEPLFLATDTESVYTYAVSVNMILSLDDRLLERARQLATRRGISLNQMIRDYLAEITGEPSAEELLAELDSLWAQSRGHSRGWHFNRRDLRPRPRTGFAGRHRS